MTSSIQTNRSKLLILDIDFHHINLNDLRNYFSAYGSIESIDTYPQSQSALITYSNEFPIEHLITFQTCFLKEKTLRLRRYRFDSANWHIDSQTLFIKLSPPIYPMTLLTETTIYQCFRNYQLGITKIDCIDNNQALISFVNYDFVDRILLMPTSTFVINDVPLVFERMMQRIPRKSRWDQLPIPIANTPVLSVRDPVVYKLIGHIEYLTKQIREQPNHLRNEINRLESEVFILKNQNATLKSKKNVEQRLTVLENISNRMLNEKSTKINRNDRSQSQEKYSKRRRRYVNENDY